MKKADKESEVVLNPESTKSEYFKMVTIPPYHPLIIDHSTQLGIAQQQEKQSEEKKVTVQNTFKSDRVRFEKQQKEEQRRKKKREKQREEKQGIDDEDLAVRKKRLLDIRV